jgi:hypothetical protein
MAPRDAGKVRLRQRLGAPNSSPYRRSKNRLAGRRMRSTSSHKATGGSVPGGIIAVADATTLVQIKRRHSTRGRAPAAAGDRQHQAVVSAAVSQRVLAGAPPDGGGDGGTADCAQRQHDEMQRRGSSSDAGQLTAVLGVHGSPVLPARTSGLPIRAPA